MSDSPAVLGPGSTVYVAGHRGMVGSAIRARLEAFGVGRCVTCLYSSSTVCDIGSGLVSLLGEEVRNKRGLSYSVYSYFAPMRRPGPFVMGAQTKNAQADEAVRVMRDTLRRFITDGPSEAQLNAAKQNLSGGFPLKVDSNKEIVQYIAMIGFYDLPLDWLDTLVGKIGAVTAAQVRDAFQRRVDPDDLLVVMVGNGSAADVGGAAGAPADADEVY